MISENIRGRTQKVGDFIYNRVHIFINSLKRIDRYNNKSIFLFLFIASFFIFGHSLMFDFFIFDDYVHIFGNRNFDKSNFLKLFNHLERPFIPLTYVVWGIVSFLVDKTNAFYFHFLNIAFHSLNSFLVFIWLKEIFRVFNFPFDLKKITTASFLGAMIFLLHPLKVESVVWVSAFKDILSFNLGIMSFILFLKSKERLSYLLFSLILMILGGLAKPNVVILFAFFLLFDIFFFKADKKRICLYIGISFIVSYFLFLYYQKSLIFNGLLVMPSFFGAVSMAARITTFYLTKIIFPFSLSFDYGLNFLTLDPDIKVYLSLLLILGLTVFVGWRVMNKKELDIFSFSIVLFFILLFPVLGFMPFIFQNISTVADRFTYFPSLAISLMVAVLYANFFSKTEKRKSATAIYLCILACLSVVQVSRWKSSESILTHSFNINNKSYPTAMALGTIAEKEKRWSNALDYYTRAYQIKLGDLHSYEKMIQIHKLLVSDEHVLISLYRQHIDDLFKTPPIVFKLLIEAYLRKGDKKNAVKYFKVFKRDIPSSSLIKELKSKIK